MSTPPTTRRLRWEEGEWLHEPPHHGHVAPVSAAQTGCCAKATQHHHQQGESSESKQEQEQQEQQERQEQQVQEERQEEGTANAGSASEAALQVTTAMASDFWRHTGYGFVHHSGHALLAEFPADSAMELEFSAPWTAQFDQAGLFLYADEEHWVKAGVEYADGVLNLGAVVTDKRSDWSVGPVPDWTTKRIRIRVSRSSDAITIRAAASPDDGSGWRLVRLAPIDPTLTWRAGPLAASPTRDGLVVTFHSWLRSPADSSIH